MSARAIPRLTPNALIERLHPRNALDRGSPAVGDALWIIDLDDSDDAAAADPSGVESALRRLVNVSCPIVGVGTGNQSDLARAVAGAVDVRPASSSDLAAITETAGSAPIASSVLVQLLRLGRGLDRDAALVAESFAYSTLQGGLEFAAWLARRGPAKPAESSDEPVRVDRSGDTLVITLDRPARRNAFSAAMRDALTESLELAVAEPGLSVELRGAGPAFCSGGDLDEFGTLSDPATAHLVRTHRSPGRLLGQIADRTVAHVHGACIGAGVELSAFASRVVAGRDAFFQLPEVRMGLVPGAGGTASLPHRIGRQRTAWLALSNQRLDAETALAWGLVDELV